MHIWLAGGNLLAEQYAKLHLFILKMFAIYRVRHAHVRKDTWPSPTLLHCKRQKAAGTVTSSVSTGSLSCANRSHDMLVSDRTYILTDQVQSFPSSAYSECCPDVR